jgi:hypothetical protein
MNCHVAHDLLQQCLDGKPIESPEWLAHLRHCADCRALASAGRRLQDGLHRLTAPQPPPGLAERIAERVLLDRRRIRRQARRRWMVRLALAAGLIVAVALRMDWRGAPSGTDIHPPEPIAKNAPLPKVEPARTLRESAAELREVFTSLGNETANETIDQTRLWVSNVPSPALPNVDLTSMEPPTRPLREAGEGVSEGLKPVTNSARRAVDLFLRELPMEDMTN